MRTCRPARWFRTSLVITTLFLGTASVTFADPPTTPHVPKRWRTPAELVNNGELPLPGPVLEVHFQYFADANPSLRLKRIAAKQGYAPTYDPVEHGYTLSLHSAAGDTLLAVLFQIPNVIFNPPPEFDEEAPDGGPVVLRAMEFALTVPWVAEAVELRVVDPQGLPIAQKSLQGIPVKSIRPTFRSLRHQHDDQSPPDGSPQSRAPGHRLLRWLDGLWMETADAATSDGVVLDITFVGDNYTPDLLPIFRQDVDRVIDHLLTYEPYKSRPAQLAFHVVDNATVDLGCVHSTSTSRLITCNNSTATTVVNDAGAPYDKIIILVNDSTYGGSGGAISVSYNGSYLPQVVVHEFAHSLAGLLDEYNLYSTNGAIDGKTYVNCYAGSPPNAAWDGLTASSDYAQGCKYPNWYRSSPCSIMRSLSCRAFNPVSQRQLSTKLDYFAGNTAPTVTLAAVPSLIGLGTSSTLTWISTNASSCTASGAWSGGKSLTGSETVTPSATATYTLTCGTATQSVTVTVDAQAPSIEVVTPSGGATVTGTVTVSASATDNRAVDRVDFYRDGALLGADNSTPYGVPWNTTGEPVGPHTLIAQAVDTAGNLGQSLPVVVSVEPSLDAQAPRVVINRPRDGAVMTGKFHVKANATDDTAVIRMELYIDGVLKRTSTSASVGVWWDTRKSTVVAGSHTISARAFDAAGNIGTASVTVTVSK